MYRKVPVCGTVACIGGSIQVLAKLNNGRGSRPAGEFIGLTEAQASGLFFGWKEDSRASGFSSWPQEYIDRFRDASTPYRKAKVVVSLLKEIVKNGPEILERVRE